MQSAFKLENNFEKRLAEGQKLQRKHGDRIAVIIEKSFTSRLNHLDKKKFLVPSVTRIDQFYSQIRNRIRPRPADFFFFVNDNAVLPTMTTMGELYADHHEDDLFLYMTYTDESPVGGKSKHNFFNLL